MIIQFDKLQDFLNNFSLKLYFLNVSSILVKIFMKVLSNSSNL